MYIYVYKSVFSLGLLDDISNPSFCIPQVLNKRKNKHIIQKQMTSYRAMTMLW